MKVLPILLSCSLCLLPICAQDNGKDKPPVEATQDEGKEEGAFPMAETLKELEPFSRKINMEADFFVLVDINVAAKQLKCTTDGMFNKTLFSKNMKKLAAIASNKKMALLLVYTPDSNDDKELKRLSQHFKKMGVRYPYAFCDGDLSTVVAPKMKLGKDDKNKYVYIFDKAQKLIKLGDESLVFFWQEYTIKPMDADKLTEKEQDYAEKRAKALEKEKSKKSSGSSGGMMCG